MRRIGLIIGIIVLLIIILLVGYFLSAQAPGDTPDGEGPVEGIGTLPPFVKDFIPSGKTGALPQGGGAVPPAITAADPKSRFGSVAQNPVLDYFVDAQNVATLIQPDGVVVRISKGTPITLSSKEVMNVIRASFSYDGKRVLLTFGDPANPQSSVFDTESKAWTPLSSEIKNPVWSPGDLRIAFLSQKDTDYAVLATMDLASAKPAAKPLTQIHAQDLSLVWPSTNLIYLSEKPSSFARSTHWKYDLSTNALSLAGAMYGLAVRWDTDGQRGVAFASNNANRGGSSYIFSNDNRIIKKFEMVTLPGKCGFAQMERTATSTAPLSASSTMSSTSKTATSTKKQAVQSPKVVDRYVICGFLSNTQEFNLSPQPDTYLQRGICTNDRIYRVHLDSGDLQNLFPDNIYTLDVSNPKVFAKNLFFVNRYDNRLYALSLDEGKK